MFRLPALKQLTHPASALAQKAGGTRLGVAFVGRVVSPLQRWLYQASGGRVSLTGAAPVLLLTTKGRKTGRARTVPVFYLRDGRRVVVCNVTPPFERSNPWTLNLRADPTALVQLGRDTIRCTGRPATADEIDRYWNGLVEIWPAYQRFFERGGTRSIFVLEQECNSSSTPF